MPVPVRRRRQRGVALLLVLWVFMVLGVLALDFGQYIREDAAAAINLSQETAGYYVAVAGMYRALWLAQQDRQENPDGGARSRAGHGDSAGMRARSQAEAEERLMPIDGEWHAGEFAGGRYEVRLTDQGGLVSLNKASETVLARVVTGLVMGPDAAVRGQDRRTAASIQALVDCMLDYRDVDRLKRTHGAEDERGYRAKNAWFDAPEELLRVPGMTRDLVYGGDGAPGLRGLVSVYNRTGQINVRTAPRALLAVLLGKDAAGIEALEAGRGADAGGFLAMVQAEVQSVDPALAEGLIDEDPRVVLVESRADVSRDRNRATVAAVVDISEDVEGAKIIRWFDRAPWDGIVPQPPGPEGLPS